MAQRKISAYWLILVAIVLAVTLALSVGATYARYVCTDQWNTLVNVEPPANQILVLDGTQVIDLGQLPLGSTAVQFSLKVEPDEAVTCGIADGITTELEKAEGVYTLTLSVDTFPDAAAVMQFPLLAGEVTLGVFQVSLPSAEATQTPENSDDTTETQPLDADVSTTTEEVIEYLQVTPRLQTEEYLKISLGVSNVADQVAITLGDGFPVGTRYSTDGGSNWYLLYFGGTIWLEAETELAVLVDVSCTAQSPVGNWALKAESYAGQTLIKTISGDVVYEAVTLTSPELMTGAEDALTVSLPQCLGEYEFKYTIEILTTDAESNLIYADATEAFAVTNDAENTMTVRFAEQLPQAGTYRLNLTWSSGETPVHQSLIPFFISYSDANTGGAE